MSDVIFEQIIIVYSLGVQCFCEYFEKQQFDATNLNLMKFSIIHKKIGNNFDYWLLLLKNISN